MQTRRYALSLLLVLMGYFLTSCHYDKRVPKSTTMTVRISPAVRIPAGVRLRVVDPVMDVEQTCELDSLGMLRIQTELLLPQAHRLYWGRDSVLFFAQPGDSVHIEIDPSQFNYRHEGVTFTGNQADFNNQFDRVYTYMARLRFPKIRVSADLPVDTIEARMTRDIQLRLDSLNAYAKRNTLLSKVTEWMETDLTYQTACRYSRAVGARSGAERLRLLTHSPLDPTNPRLFQSRHYARYLDDYRRALLDDRLRGGLFDESPKEYLREATDVICKQSRASLCRDYMLYQLVWSMRETSGLDELMSEIPFMFTNVYIPDRLTQRIRDDRAEREREAALDAERIATAEE